MQTSSLHALLIVFCWRAVAGLAGEPAPHLDIFLLSEGPLQDYHFIDTPAYPKLGYVAPRPDLVISHLKGVSIGEPSDSAAGPAEKNSAGKSSLEMRLTPADAEALETFSAANVGKRIVFMLGERPLFAPILRTPLSTQTIQINPPEGADVQELKRELEALVSKSK